MTSSANRYWLEPHEPAWDAVLMRLQHDFYHLPGYLRMSAAMERGEATAFCVERGDDLFFLPMILRSVSEPDGTVTGLRDVICPYGYAAPLARCEAQRSPEFVEMALRELVRELRERRVVSAFFRLHPLLGCSEEALARVGYVHESGATVAVDLSQSPAEIWRQTRSGHRSDIARSRKEGLQVEMAPYGEHLGEFREIYYQTMRRVDADERYVFPLQYFLDLKEALGDRLHLCVARIDGRIAAAALFTEIGGIVQYHLSGVHDCFISRRPTKILLDYARSWARERGNAYLHLGGGLGGRRDSLFDFKAGFSDLHLPFKTWRLVIDPASYSCLSALWRDAAGSEPDDIQGFFPAYRKPMPERVAQL